MTWQEELRKLDESLASGNLSADEYRTRRDQILSSAVSAPEQGDTGDTGGADSTQIIAPLSGQPSQQGPPSQPQQSGQQGPPSQPQQQQQAGAEATQVVSPAGMGAEQTQAVQPWQQQQGGQSYPASPAEGFQQPQQPQQPPASPPAGFAAQAPPNQPWNAPQEDSSPPWGGGELAPLSPPTSTDWGVSQGPEGFDDPEPSGKGRKVLLSVIAFVLVAGIGVAVYFLFIADSGSEKAEPKNDGQSQQQPPPPSPTSQPLPKPPPAKEEPADNETALIEPPGKERDGGGPFDYKTLENDQKLPGSVVEALDDADMDEGLLRTTVHDDATIGLFAVEVGSEETAIEIANEYAVSQQEGGIPSVSELSMQGVQVFGAKTSKESVYRGVYVLYDRVIVIDVHSKDDAAESVFSELLEEQVNHAPPSYTDS